jgi:hypothetical protein
MGIHGECPYGMKNGCMVARLTDFCYICSVMNNDDSLHFRDVEQSDKPVISTFLQRYPTRKLNYCFEVLYLWREACEFQIEFLDDFLLIKTFIDCHHNFLYPLGSGNTGEVIEKMILYSEARRCPFRLFQIPAHEKEWMEAHFPGRFEFELSRDEMEYLYSTAKLTGLSGKKLQHKRNHINYFEQNYKWRFEPLTPSNLPDCHTFNRKWFDGQRANEDYSEMLASELLAIEKAFDEWETLGLDGALLRMDGEIVAYTVGCPLAGDTYLVLFEKSRHDIRGASQQINRLFVREYAQNYTYINRAEDNGSEGLRQAKLSYYPDLFDEIYTAKLSEQ